MNSAKEIDINNGMGYFFDVMNKWSDGRRPYLHNDHQTIMRKNIRT